MSAPPVQYNQALLGQPQPQGWQAQGQQQTSLRSIATACDASEKKDESLLAGLSELNERAARHPWVRNGKTVVFFCIAMYGLVTSLQEFAATFQQHAEFSTELPDERCMPRFYQALEYAERHPAAIVGFWVSSGKSRVAVCANATDEELDAEFSDMNVFDPLSQATKDECSLGNEQDVAAAASSCYVKGTAHDPRSRRLACDAAFATMPRPRGIGWKYVVQRLPSTLPAAGAAAPASNASGPAPTVFPPVTASPAPTPPAPSSTNASGAAESNWTIGTRCAAMLTVNPELPTCPHANVRFYDRTNPFISLLYITLAFYTIGMLVLEAKHLFQFTNEDGPHFGDLTYMIVPFDGSLGAFYALYRLVKSLPPVSELPDPTLFVFARAAVGSLLGFAVSIIALVGCPVTWNLQMFILLLLSAAKFLYDTASYALPRLGVCGGDSGGDKTGKASGPSACMNDTPLPDDDADGIAMLHEARGWLRTARNGQLSSELSCFAVGNPELRRQILESVFPQAEHAVKSRAANSRTADARAAFEPAVEAAMKAAVEAERPLSLARRLLGPCFPVQRARDWPSYVTTERARVLGVLANPHVDAFLVRRKAIARLCVVEHWQAAMGVAPSHVPAMGAVPQAGPVSQMPGQPQQHMPTGGPVLPHTQPMVSGHPGHHHRHQFVPQAPPGQGVTYAPPLPHQQQQQQAAAFANQQHLQFQQHRPPRPHHEHGGDVDL